MGATRTREQSEELRLMSRLREREVSAAEELFLRFAPRIFGIGIRAFRDADLAADLVERTFVKLWHRAPNFSSSSLPLDTWVLAQALGMALEMSGSPAAVRDLGGSMARRRTDAQPVPV